MELIPNIRFITGLLICISVPVLVLTAVFQPSDAVVGALFGLAVVIGFTILIRHDSEPSSRRRRGIGPERRSR